MVTALLVASKLEEYYPVNIKKLLHLTENSYSRVEVTHMERTVLDVMEFQVFSAILLMLLLINFFPGLSTKSTSLSVAVCTSGLPVRRPRVPEDLPVPPGHPPPPSLPPLSSSFPPSSCCRGLLLPPLLCVG